MRDNIIRKTTGDKLFGHHGPQLAELFESQVDAGVTVQGGAEIMTLIAVKRGEGMHDWLRSFDGADAFNSTLYRHRILPSVAEIIPPTKGGTPSTFIYGREQCKMIYAMGDGTTACGDNICPGASARV